MKYPTTLFHIITRRTSSIPDPASPAAAGEEKEPSPLAGGEKNPSHIAGGEKKPSHIAGGEKKPSHIAETASSASFLIIAGAVFLLDWITKIVVRNQLFLGAEIPVLPFFNIVHVRNTGIAFGLFQGRNTVFLLFGLVMMGALFWIGLRVLKSNPFSGRVLAGVLGGAMGNILDRILYGRVTDFLDFHLAGVHWPAFNVADAAICVGAILLIAESLKGPRAARR